jgi:hypothetical protein
MLKIGVAMYTLERVEGFDPHVYHAKMGRRFSFSAHERNAKRRYLFLQRESAERKLNFVAVSKNDPALRKQENVPFILFAQHTKGTKLNDFIEGSVNFKLISKRIYLLHWAFTEK